MMNKIIQRRIVPNIPSVVSDPLLDRLYRSRSIQHANQLDLSFKSMLSPSLLAGMESAVELLINSYQTQEKIIIVGDFDADGATSTSLAILALRALGFTNVSYLIPNRFEQGYGLSVAVAEQALAQEVQLLITVDNGVSSFEGVLFLKENGVKVLVTDHHLPPETLPPADAIINPNLEHCAFPSKALAGVGVTFYLMLALRAKMRELGYFKQRTEPNFAELIDLVALGTVADVVPLDQNNRIFAYQGLNRIRQSACRCGIRALVEVANKDITQLSTTDLGFSIAPRLNAAGRLDTMSIGVELLLAEDMSKARTLALTLDDLNQSRKEIEQEMKLEALEICRKLTALSMDLPLGIALYQQDWHQGVLGILASRLKDQYHRPVIVFAQDQEGMIKGSARSIEGVHMRDVLERISSRYPDLLIKFGGHAMAAGLTILERNFSQFQQIFNQTVEEWLDDGVLQGIVWTDGELNYEQLNLATAEKLRQAGPWGQAFPEPLFDGEFAILQQRLVAEKHLKMLVEPKQGGDMIDAIAFNVDLKHYPDFSMRKARLVYRLDVNEFRGQRNVQLIVEYMEPM